MYVTIVTLVQHYFDYLRSPPVLLSILVIVGPIALELFKNYKLQPVSAVADVPGCFRLGLLKRSNLHDQYVQPNNEFSPPRSPRIAALFTYPVKSCRGIELAASEVGPTGLKYDRLFTFAQLLPKAEKLERGAKGGDQQQPSKAPEHEWRFITQREFPRLAMIQTELWIPKPGKSKGPQQAKKPVSLEMSQRDTALQRDDGDSASGGRLILRFPSRPRFSFLGLRDGVISVRLPLTPSTQHMADAGYALEPLSIWIDTVKAINVTGEMESSDLSTLAAFLGVRNPLGLFRVDHQHLRAVTRSLPRNDRGGSYRVGFADAFPFHVLNLASVRAQNDEMSDKSALKGKLDARRFRANVYINGPPAYDEDSWKKVTMGRCINPDNSRTLNGSANHSGSTVIKQVKTIEADGKYHVACRTARCKLPNVDQDTGERDANEPLRTLRQTRQIDRGAYPHPCLGMQMIPLFQQGILRVGDEVEVLERGEHVYETMFS